MPDDCDVLKEMVLTLLSQIDDLHGQLHYLKRQLFGKKSEKLDPNQRLLFENLYEQVQARDRTTATGAQRNPSRRARTPTITAEGRCRKTCAREPIEIEPTEAEKTCVVCGTAKERIGQEVTEKLEYVPASFYVKQYIRPKYACKVVRR